MAEPTPQPPQVSIPGARPRVVRVPPPVDARVSEIVELMERGEWGPQRERELAERWGVTRERMRSHSAEASRHLRLLDREAAAARVEAILAKAESAAAYSKTRAGDLVRVALARMKFYGLDRPAPRGATVEAGSSGAREIEAAEDWWEGDGDGAEKR